MLINFLYFFDIIVICDFLGFHAKFVLEMVKTCESGLDALSGLALLDFWSNNLALIRN